MKYRNSKGFTLIELIVVIAIIGVLAAVLVPNYLQYVEKARTAVCENARSELTHFYDIERAATGRTDYAELLQNIFTEHGASSATTGSLSGITTIKCTGLCPTREEAEFTFVLDARGNVSSTRCSVHGSQANGIVLGSGDDPNKKLLQSYIDAGSPADSIDSTAVGIGTNIGSVLNKLGDYDLGGLNVQSWAIRKNKDVTTVTISDQDIAGMPLGTKVRAIRYNTKTKRYTVVYCEIVSNTLGEKAYNVMKAERFEPVSIDGKTDGVSAYEDALKVFNSIGTVK